MSEAAPSDGARYITIDKPSAGVARITLNRPEKRNAQNFALLYQLEECFHACAHDGGVSVIVLASTGPDFSAGHDLSQRGVLPSDFDVVGNWGEYEAPGDEGRYGIEKEAFLELTERWRNLPKPTIAQVQGRCIAAGNMLAWACDLIVAADNAMFCDNTIDMGIPGAEFFNHPYELGIRKAKEWLFTGGWMTAAEARELGMVNHVVAPGELEAFTLRLAARIAAQDAMGRRETMSISFALHELCHSHNMQAYGAPIYKANLDTKILK
jgi:enoyl-CoA hydratase